MVFSPKVHSSFFYSVLLHGIFFFVWFIYATQQSTNGTLSKRAPLIIEVDPLPKVSTRDQVVQTERAKKASTAVPDSFLGEQTQNVEKQTISMPKVGSAAKSSDGKKLELKTVEAAAPKTAPVIHATGPLAKFGIAVSAGKEESPKPKKVDLAQEASMTAQARGEYVKGFKAGEETMLNTREYVFYGYFQRIRQRLDRAWDLSLKDRLVKYFYRGRQLASETDYMTQLLVVLDTEGRITKVQIIGPSGTSDLDEAAIKAFNDAGPFPNPPKGLLDPSNQVLVRWDFVLKT